ncbi:serine hydrolase domain-containing protein [Pseudonocardia bannensis]|uniref:Beta-lactamase family protein n=1 Tax=Pseudonocardia bannensis TaxID=630973 RepID=A0A848DH01_9PSEU|nr:serine hydrolase domain-containing protein [Pseudonocardia bannensis]NMH91846.1 beta-lactamase family protein [Pseudonocardia bannensis]
MNLIRPFAIVALSIGMLASCTSATNTPAQSSPPSAHPTTTAASADPAQAAAVDKVVQDAMKARHLRAVIVRVTTDGKEIITKAYGESMTGVPATIDMHFRNGAIAISYVSTLLLILVDEKKVSLDDKISTWVPEIPHSDEVTLGQLAHMTSGYTDYVIGNEEVDVMLYTDPFRQWAPEELLKTVTSKPLLYPPGTNWNYAHTNYLILGLALERLTGKRMSDLMQEKVLGPLRLTNTTDPGPGTPAIPEPALHAFTSERRSQLGIPAGTRFYEESTYWNPSWTITRGAIQTTDIFDVNETAVAMGTGRLLSQESYRKMISTDLRGATTALPGCATCFPQSEAYSYGLGIVTTGNWLMQNPLFSGEAGAFAYLPSKKVAIALALTFAEDAFAPDGSYKSEVGSNAVDPVWREIATVVAPDDPPPPMTS